MALAGIKNIYSGKSNNAKYFVAILAILGFSQALAQDGFLQQPDGQRTATAGGLTGQIEHLADPFTPGPAFVRAGQSRLVFYRPRQANLPTAADKANLVAIDDNGKVINNATNNVANNALGNGIRYVTRPLELGARQRVQNLAQTIEQDDTTNNNTNTTVINDPRQPGAASIFVNGDYQTSLVPGGYSELCLAPANVKAGVRYRDVERNANAARLDSISEVPLQDGRTQYIRVQEQAVRNGAPRLVLVPVDQDRAVRELDGTRLQMHTVSRVKGQQPCQAVAVQATEAITLAGDTLFMFNRSDRAGLTDHGINALEQLMLHLRTRYKSVEHVHLIGYTDPLGSNAYNQRLSEQRASTVSEYMQISPLLRGRVTTEGRGPKELVVTGCGNTPTPQTQACNQPNRRVVVQVTGVRN